MLLEMRLRGLGVIRDAVLELGPGLTVVTGETGAGKTMVVTGLGLLMGGRADAGAVREGEQGAFVEGQILLDPAGPAAARALEAGAVLDDGDVLIMSRTVSAEGRSRAHLGGRSVPVGVLGELADELVTVHGQNEQIRLRSTARQREALDRFAGDAVAVPLAAYRSAWARLRAVETEIDEITRLSRERAQEAELLRLGLAEIERVDPQPSEDVELRAEAQRLAHAEELRTAATTAHLALAGDPDASSDAADVTALLSEARRALEAVRHHDEDLAGLADRVGELAYLAADIAADCAAYTSAVESDPIRLAAIEERRAVLKSLTRAYGEDIDGVLAWAKTSGARLGELDSDDDRIEGLRLERESLRTTLGRLGGEISHARQVAGARLADLVSAELTELSMPDARLVVEVRQRDDLNGLPVVEPVPRAKGAKAVAAAKAAASAAAAAGTDGPRLLAAGPDGVDEVELLLAPHAGASPRPLGKGASGGELSRVMLGLEVVLGAVDPVPTFVFDEVDAGVGGKAAIGIGRRLARLAATSQVLVVTHLAQVAAFADRHLLVVKSKDGEVTESGVRLLDDEGRVRELARMLGGIEESDSAQAHAEELLTSAKADRALG
nr:DNA repair protein RecN [Kineosporia sp. R_H_3]